MAVHDFFKSWQPGYLYIKDPWLSVPISQWVWQILHIIKKLVEKVS